MIGLLLLLLLFVFLFLLLLICYSRNCIVFFVAQKTSEDFFSSFFCFGNVDTGLWRYMLYTDCDKCATQRQL